VNKVDKKGRVSVPASYRSALADDRFAGIVAFPSLTLPAIEAFSRGQLEEMSRRQADRSLEAGEYDRFLLGGASDSAIETILAISHELPFDGEGRISLPDVLARHAGIDERAVFVGRGNRFQIWAPEPHERHQAETLARLRERFAGSGGRGL
jgi:MraZ protein